MKKQKKSAMSRKRHDTPHSTLQANSTPTAVPRPFLPPSYYAAAGGIPYPRKPTSTGFKSPSTPAVDRISEERAQSTQAIQSPSSESDRLFQSRLKGPQQRSQGDRKSLLPSHASSSRNQGLPDVEADLLPTLQSTIHRMTRPPSRILADTTNTPSYDSQPDALKRRAAPASRVAFAGSSSEAPGANLKSRIPQKSALKSALRTPMRDNEPAFRETGPTLMPTPSTPRSPSRGSLRSVKSLLSRKLGTSNENVPPSPAMSPGQPNTGRARDYPPNSPASHLPRPKAGSQYQQSTPSFPQQPQTISASHTEESDFENKYERQWMERRRLTVANAEVVPSPSSSDSSMSSSYDNFPTPKLGHYSQKTSQPIRHASASSGLGFDIRRRYAPATTNSPPLPNIVEFPDRERAKILRFSLPPSGSDASLYSNHQLSYPGSWDTDCSTEPEEFRVSVQSASTASSAPRRNSVPPEEVQRAYWSDGGQSGSGSEEFQSDDQEYHHQQDRRYNEAPQVWRDTPKPPAISQYRPRSSDRSASTPRTIPHRLGFGEVRKRPDHRSTPQTPYADHQWDAPKTPMPGQADPSNTWFNESSGSFEADEFDHIPTTPHRTAPAPPKFEQASLSQEMRRQAAQQREAFGLPPSVSDEHTSSRAQRWSQSDSHRSSVASSRWGWNEEQEGAGDGDDDVLSSGAEDMIKRLHPEWSRGMPAMSSASSAASFYDDQNETFETATEETPQNTSIESTRTAAPSSRSANEKRRKHLASDPREDIILEFIRSEEEFLANTQICVDSFILPIRTENSRSWIGGVPTNVSRLLDWFEDITNLHLGVYQSLESSSAMQESDMISAGLASYLYEFVGKLHIYQPYLVSLADVLEEVSALVVDSRNDFGEFIRIEERSLQASGWTFEQLLMEPVNRLGVYQDLFSRLLEATPEDHPEFLATLSLSRSADTMMRVMTEVKVRETEHRLIRSLALQIEDPAVSKLLASRERRLLHSGTLRLISPSIDLGAQPLSHQAKAQKRSSKLVQAITHWDNKPERSGSLKSIASSVKSFSTTSSFASGPSLPLDSRTSRVPLLKGLFKGKTATTSSLPASILKTGTSEAPSDCVEVFVFSDIALFLLPKATAGSKYCLVPKVGLAKVFSVAFEETGSTKEIRVQVIATNTSSLESDTLPRCASITDVILEVPRFGVELSGSCGDSPEDENCGRWIIAFEKSAQDTAQLLSCPGPRKAVPSQRSKDTWSAVSSLIASGLPMPRSASGQLPDLEYGRMEEEARKLEREERGWWSLQYQQILGEYVHSTPGRVHDQEERNFV